MNNHIYNRGTQPFNSKEHYAAKKKKKSKKDLYRLTWVDL
jgi:hypothetical protein